MALSTRTINFEKWEGAGNDFVVVDELLPVSAIRQVCDRRYGVGSDGVLVCADGCMRIFNSDGSEAEMCGNGLRIAHAYTGWEEIEVGGQTYRCWTTERGIATPLRARVLRRGAVWLVDTGVPHAVVPAGTDPAPVRRRENANVTWYEENWVHTYERGVEGVTLACGTGIAAAHLVGYERGEMGGSAVLRSHGGDLFYSTVSGGEVILEGPARQIFSGKFFLQDGRIRPCKPREGICQ